ncbi:MAG: HAD-IA family hydrolase, partial [Candidatus Paceibacterota bacterium]
EPKLRYFFNKEDGFQRDQKRQVFDKARDLSEFFSLVLLTNQIQFRAEHIKQHENFSSFDRVFFSSDIGLKKPDPKIFNFVLEKIKKVPGDCLYVDDSAENIETAVKMGFKTYQWENV